MKCPHCKKPVNVQVLKLGPGRTGFTMNKSLKRKADASRLRLGNAIKFMRTKGMTFREIADGLDVSETQCYIYLEETAALAVAKDEK